MNNTFRLVLALSILAGLLAGCRSSGVLRDGFFQGHGVKYSIGEPGDGWRRDRLPDADLAWIYQGGSASLLVNSRCRGSKDAPLDALAGQLLIGMTDQKEISAVRDARSQREGLETTTSAKLDGVPLRIRSYVLKKDLCVYDIVLAADPAYFAAALAGYDLVKSRFDVEGKPRDQ